MVSLVGTVVTVQMCMHRYYLTIVDTLFNLLTTSPKNKCPQNDADKLVQRISSKTNYY